MALEKKDPKLFWKGVKELIRPYKNDNTNISPNMWSTHFSGLLNSSCKKRDEQFHEYVSESLPTLESIAPSNGPLDFNITPEEIERSINTLKNNRSHGPDLISNIMLKRSCKQLLNPLTSLFNLILKNQKYPKQWDLSYITPIHKKGDLNDANNYRGIAISSCLSKVFTSILNYRLTNYMSENNLWRRNQCGFMKGHRTEDNLFILQTLFQKYAVNKHQKLYIAFVDFSKYFDTIDRDSLYYKMLKLGLHGHFYHLIKSMYSGTKFSVKIMNGSLPYFISRMGVKQGCNLSPTLANLFQNDLHDIFDKECNPVTLGNITFNSLSWADDLVLLATSSGGLQRCLEKLQTYCYKWGLTVNERKTKWMTFSNGSRQSAIEIEYDNNIIEQVRTFT